MSRSKAASLEGHASTIHPSMRTTTHVSRSFVPEKIEAKPYPIAIGTRGTVGSLIMQEIDHFSQLELGGASSSKKPSNQPVDLPLMSHEFLRPELESAIAIPMKKKRGSRRLIPSICSLVEVANINQSNSVSGFAYTNLKNRS
ncbi:hypothetical protein C2S53_006391 [Perilla frutescens var. hirtella]|uniref:Uncharacterized protein n=1 Tax=Perilla frutescens var. hirtella TaxID=608512 RepID=A0AAD4JKI1_PERFH|nr:hypothetical protein C2S53_006391 [Perilla frutescens var. hirtella]